MQTEVHDIVDSAEDDWEDEPLLRRDRPPIDAEMDITPMIDVTFLLLIFFMVTSTLDQQATVDLAVARNGDAVTEKDSVIFSVGAGGIEAAPVYVGEHLAEDAQLSSNLDAQREQIRETVERAKQQDRKHQVLIMADRNVAHRDVARVIKAASQVPEMSIHLAVHEEH